MNSLYIPLTNHDGDNSDLIDPHGGAHHLKNSEIKIIGNSLASKMDEDPTIAMKYIKMLTKFGNPDKIPEAHKELIGKHAGLQKLDKDTIRKNYLDGLESPDVDPRKFLSLYHSTGLLKNVFPGVEFDSKTAPQGLRGDRWLSTAWLLKDQEPHNIYDLLSDHGWSKSEANDVAYLVKFYQWATKNNFDPMQFHDMKSIHTGLTKSKIRDWMKMSKAHSPEVDSFLTIDTSDLKPYSQGQYGQRMVNPMYQDVLGRSPVGKEFDMVKKFLSSEKWKDSLDKMKKSEDK
jgi:tRNA nucleotidyltransferase/poly(A) polymerase